MMLLVHILIFCLVLAGLVTILVTKNVVHAAYALGLVLLGIAGVYVLLNAELLAVVQILLYAGGVVILLVFGVMMTTRLKGDKVLSESKNQAVAAIISLALFAFLVWVFTTHSFELKLISGDTDQIEQIGIAFLTEHLVAFELIAFVLLVALVGAAYLAKMSSDD